MKPYYSNISKTAPCTTKWIKIVDPVTYIQRPMLIHCCYVDFWHFKINLKVKATGGALNWQYLSNHFHLRMKIAKFWITWHIGLSRSHSQGQWHIQCIHDIVGNIWKMPHGVPKRISILDHLTYLVPSVVLQSGGPTCGMTGIKCRNRLTPGIFSCGRIVTTSE